jgi:hypothetical protein
MHAEPHGKGHEEQLMSNKRKCFALGLLRSLGGLVALALCWLIVSGYYAHTDAGGPMLIFLLVDYGTVWWFVIATVFAAILHHISGSYQKVTITFAVLVGAALWFGNEPYAEPFPGAIQTIVLIATALQVLFACLAYIVRDRNPEENKDKQCSVI